MTASQKRTFIARTIYHHTKKTSEFVTLIVYRDPLGNYELWDDREAKHDFLSGNEAYILEEWGKRNRELIEQGFQRDNMMGENKWLQFIT